MRKDRPKYPQRWNLLNFLERYLALAPEIWVLARFGTLKSRYPPVSDIGHKAWDLMCWQYQNFLGSLVKQITEPRSQSSYASGWDVNPQNVACLTGHQRGRCSGTIPKSYLNSAVLGCLNSISCATPLLFNALTLSGQQRSSYRSLSEMLEQHHIGGSTGHLGSLAEMTTFYGA